MSDKSSVLLITSAATQNTVQDSIALSYGLHLLKNTLDIHDIGCEVVDLEITSADQCLEIFEKGGFNIVGISVTHSNMIADLDYLHRLKNLARKIGRQTLFIAGGMSATLNYRDWLKGGFDVILTGYAEESLLDLCRNYSRETDTAALNAYLGKADGVAFKTVAGETVFNPSKVLTEEYFQHHMYTLPMGMKMPYDRYWDFMRSRNTGALSMNNRSFVVENARLYTASKCLANCGYCCCPAFVPTSQNSSSGAFMLSAEQIYDLVVDNVAKHGARAFSINDEDFLVGSVNGIKRVADFCDLVIKGKRATELPVEIRFSCQARASDFLVPGSDKTKEVNFSLIRKMAEAKFHNVSLGIETFSQRLVKSPSVNKPGVSVDDYHNVLKAMMEHGLFPTINLIIGIPEETPEELLQTIEDTLCYIDQPCQVSVNIKMSAYPGAPIWNSECYPTKDQVWTHPESGEEIKIPLYYIPRDSKLARIVENLERDVHVEVALLKERHGMTADYILPRIALALCAFNSISKQLGNTDLSNRITAKLDDMIAVA